MITLITGAPGAGKTSLLVHLLLTDLSINKRKVYAHGIRDLKIPTETVLCHSQNCEVCQDVSDSSVFLYCDDDDSIINDSELRYSEGSIIIIDECQRVFRPLPSSKERPNFVRALETHRHHGYDFYIITQNPSLIDSHVRGLVSRHLHIKKTWLTTFIFEWPECKNSLSVSDAIKSKYSVPKKVFDYYKSAELHTEHIHKKPFVFYAFFVMIFFIFSGVYYAKTRFNEKISQNQVVESKQAQAGADETAELFDLTDYELDDLRKLEYFDIKRMPFFCSHAGRFVSCYVPRSDSRYFKNFVCDKEKCKIYIKKA